MISDMDDDATIVIHAQVDSWTLNLISSYFMTTSSEGWPEALTKSVVAQISSYRKKRGLSYQQLAEQCTELGYPTLRTTLANLEAHKRKSLTLHELIILAAALDVPPVELLFPAASRMAKFRSFRTRSRTHGSLAMVHRRDPHIRSR